MGLQVYRKKRRFDTTPEPRGKRARTKGNRFVIQKHAATRLHYDFRLELGGVLKSWAVTRGPSLVPEEKRLAVHVEDHPIEYGKFEGTIPKGEYGGGTVLLWDRGTWTPEGDPHKGYAKGHLAFTLDGEKLKGAWHLVRMKKRPGERQEPWLLIKSDDEAARDAKAKDILEEAPDSVTSGRSIEEIAAGMGKKRVWHSNKPARAQSKPGSTVAPAPRKSAARFHSAPAKSAKKKAKRGNDALPDFVPPALASLRDHAPPGGDWVHEIKFDGYRIQARLDDGRVRLLTRKGLDWTRKFENIAQEVAVLPATSALLDGELVVEDEHGVSSFPSLQDDLKSGRTDRFVYYVFDLLHLDGEDLTKRPLIKRKAELKQLLGLAKAASGPLRLSEHFDEDGALVYGQACRMNLEGIVSKRKGAPYRSGRTDAFVKVKCANAQELVVAGYAPSSAMSRAVGALIVGYYESGKLRYAGRVGTGYTQKVAKELWNRLHALEIDKPPFDKPPQQERRSNARWVRPEVVIETHFRGWTTDGLLRQAAFKGVREDKPAKEVVREVPVMTGKGKAKKSTPGKSTSKRSEASSYTSSVRFTHPDRVYWPDVGVTKQNLADYYTTVWDWMAPHVVGRISSLVRCPEGTKGECFFQKHAHAGIEQDRLRMVKDHKGKQIISVDNLDGLLSLVQAGVLEVHVRGSRIEHLDKCDLLIFDLDPGDGVEWREIVAGARDVRERLAGLKLKSFVKLSGGKGLHVALPIDPVDWDTAKNFAGAVAARMALDDPGRYVAKMTKSLRKGRIFIDYFRNSEEATSIAAYSTRARDGAPVSMPVSWDELGRVKSANQYTVLNIKKRLGALKADPWKDISRVRQKLPDMKAPSRAA